MPGQNEWNPGERLVELARRQSQVLEGGTLLLNQGRVIPDREMVGGGGGKGKEKVEGVVGKGEGGEWSASDIKGEEAPLGGGGGEPVFGTPAFAVGDGDDAVGGGKGEVQGMDVAPEEQVRSSG